MHLTEIKRAALAALFAVVFIALGPLAGPAFAQDSGTPPAEPIVQEVDATLTARITVFTAPAPTDGSSQPGEMTTITWKGVGDAAWIGNCQDRASDGKAKNAEINKEWSEAIAATDAVPYGAILNFLCRTETVTEVRGKADTVSTAVEIPPAPGTGGAP